MAKKSYSKSKIMRDHELQMAMINAFAKDPELKYFVGMAAGAGVAWVGAMLPAVGGDITRHPNYNPWTKRIEEGYTPSPWATTPEEFAAQQDTMDMLEATSSVPFGYLLMPHLLAQKSWKKKIDEYKGNFNFDMTGGLASQMGNIMLVGGTGFAGTCAMILILKAIFSGTDLGEILQGVGEIIPL